MARKASGAATKQPAQRVQSVPELPPTRGDVIPEGDFAGMTYDEVLELTHAALEEALGPLSIGGALAAQDRLLAQSLELAAYVEGDKFAHEAALKFAQTLMPFIQVEERLYQQAYSEVLKLKDRVRPRVGSWSTSDE